MFWKIPPHKRTVNVYKKAGKSVNLAALMAIGFKSLEIKTLINILLLILNQK